MSDDGLLHKNGNSYTRSDLEVSINQLDDSDTLELFHYIANYSDLQNFLSYQDESYIVNFRLEAIYLQPYFISFVSPFFAYSFDKVAYKAYLKGTNQYFHKVNSIKLLLTTTDISVAYKSLLNHLTIKKNEVDNITTEIRNKTTANTNSTIRSVFDKYKAALNADKINSLPEIHQEVRNQIAYSFRNLSVNIYNFFEDSLLSLEVSNYSLLFNVTGLTKDELTKDYEEIQRLHNEKVENKKNEAVITKYVELIEAGDVIAEQVKTKTASGTNAIHWVNSKIPFAELNSLPASLNEIKSQVALVIKRLSVIVWNTYEDSETSLRLIEKSLAITITDEAVKKTLNEAKMRLLELNLKREMEGISEMTDNLTDDDVTDKKYQLEDKKRKIALEIGNATMNKRLEAAKADYYEAKVSCELLIKEDGNDQEQKYFNDIAAQETLIFSTKNPIKIKELGESYHSIKYNILWRTPDFLIRVYNSLCDDAHKMNDQPQAKSYVDAGKFAIESKNWTRLAEIDRGLLGLLPRSAQQDISTKIGF